MTDASSLLENSFFTTFERLVDSESDRALLLMLKKHADSFIALLDVYKEIPDDELYRVQKSYRQIDVTGCGTSDMVIWHLISASSYFWEAVDIYRGGHVSKHTSKSDICAKYDNVKRRYNDLRSHMINSCDPKEVAYIKQRYGRMRTDNNSQDLLDKDTPRYSDNDINDIFAWVYEAYPDTHTTVNDIEKVSSVFALMHNTQCAIRNHTAGDCWYYDPLGHNDFESLSVPVVISAADALKYLPDNRS